MEALLLLSIPEALAICDDDFYILPHPAVRLRVEERLRGIIGDHRPHKPDNLVTTTDGP